MSAHERNDAFNEGIRSPEASQERFSKGNAGFLVARRNDPHLSILEGLVS